MYGALESIYLYYGLIYAHWFSKSNYNCLCFKSAMMHEQISKEKKNNSSINVWYCAWVSRYKINYIALLIYIMGLKKDWQLKKRKKLKHQILLAASPSEKNTLLLVTHGIVHYPIVSA